MACRVIADVIKSYQDIIKGCLIGVFFVRTELNVTWYCLVRVVRINDDRIALGNGHQ